MRMVVLERVQQSMLLRALEVMIQADQEAYTAMKKMGVDTVRVAVTTADYEALRDRIRKAHEIAIVEEGE